MTAAKDSQTKYSDPDTLLIEEIRRGEATAWNRLIAEYEGRLLAFVSSRLAHYPSSRRGASEDVVQETFIGFLISLPNYDPRRPLESWLFSIAAHKLTDYLRREGRRPAVPFSTGTHSSGDNWEVAGPDRKASSIVRSGERQGLENKVLAEGIDQQLKRWRASGDWQKIQCLELLFVAGQSNQHVARVLHLSEQQVANWKHDFLQRLRKFVRTQQLHPEIFPELC